MPPRSGASRAGLRAERRRAARRRLRGAATEHHTERGAAATITSRRSDPPFGVVELADDGLVTGFREAPMLPTGSTAASTSSARRRSRGCPSAATTSEHVPRARGRGQAARVPARGHVADREHAEGPAQRRGVHGRASGVASRAPGDSLARDRPLDSPTSRDSTAGPSRRARREAVGLRADLGRHRALLREGALRPGRRGAQPPVPRARRTSPGTSSRAARSSSSATPATRSSTRR